MSFLNKWSFWRSSLFYFILIVNRHNVSTIFQSKLYSLVIYNHRLTWAVRDEQKSTNHSKNVNKKLTFFWLFGICSKYSILCCYLSTMCHTAFHFLEFIIQICMCIYTSLHMQEWHIYTNSLYFWKVEEPNQKNQTFNICWHSTAEK